MADDSFDVWWKALWEDKKVIDFELEKNINEMNDEPNGTTNLNENTPNVSSKPKRKRVDASNSKLYEDNGGVNELLDNQDKTVSKDNFKDFKKTMLEEETRNYYDILPKNWIEMTHKSGMVVYLHTPSRTVSLTRPYFLGSDDPELHKLPPVPLSLLVSQGEKSSETKETIINDHDLQTSKLDNMIIPTAKVENAQENIIKDSFFKFKKVNAPLEQSPLQHSRNSIERPLLPDSNKITSLPVQSKDHNNFEEWVLHQYGKSYVYILKEYLTKIFKIKPFYDFKEIENSETPYSASVILKEICYGVGFGKTKEEAKLNAAQATIYILIPEMKKKIDSDKQIHHYPEIFNQLQITDPRVIPYSRMYSKHYYPYHILLLCLQRNFNGCDLSCRYYVMNGQPNEFYMRTPQHVVFVHCENKKDGKQMASQELLNVLHPPIDNWGSLLYLYDGLKLKTEAERMKSLHDTFHELQKEMLRAQAKLLKDSNTPLLPDSK